MLVTAPHLTMLCLNSRLSFVKVFNYWFREIQEICNPSFVVQNLSKQNWNQMSYPIPQVVTVILLIFKLMFHFTWIWSAMRLHKMVKYLNRADVKLHNRKQCQSHKSLTKTIPPLKISFLRNASSPLSCLVSWGCCPFLCTQLLIEQYPFTGFLSCEAHGQWPNNMLSPVSLYT